MNLHDVGIKYTELLEHLARKHPRHHWKEENGRIYYAYLGFNAPTPERIATLSYAEFGITAIQVETYIMLQRERTNT